jgi:hypothetical protein
MLSKAKGRVHVSTCRDCKHIATVLDWGRRIHMRMCATFVMAMSPECFALQQ